MALRGTKRGEVGLGGTRFGPLYAGGDVGFALAVLIGLGPTDFGGGRDLDGGGHEARCISARLQLAG